MQWPSHDKPKEPVLVCECTCGVCSDPWKATFARVTVPVVVYVLFLCEAIVWMLIVFSDANIGGSRRTDTSDGHSHGHGHGHKVLTDSNWEAKLIGAVNVLTIASVLSLAGLHIPRTAARITVAIAGVITLITMLIHAFRIARYVFLPWVDPREPMESAIGIYVLIGEAAIAVILIAITAGFKCCNVLQ